MRLTNSDQVTVSISGKADQRVPQLDAIRGIAISLVIVWHLANFKTSPGSLEAYFLKSLFLIWAGVDLFFVLSGFLIGGILLDNRLATNYFSIFYLRRATRIFPLYYVVFGLFLLVVGLHSLTPTPASAWLVEKRFVGWTYLLYMQNFSMAYAGEHGANGLGMTWSLAVEEQFYLVLPFVIRFTPRSSLPIVLVLLAVSAPVVRSFLYFTHPFKGFPGYVLLPGRADSLLCGVLVAYCVRKPSISLWLRNHKIGLAGFALAMLISSSLFIVTNQGIGSLWMSLVGHTWLAILCSSMILVALYVDWDPLQRIFRSKVLIWLGSISYGIYMLHQIVNGLSHHFLTGHEPYIADWRDLFVTLLGLAITLGVSQLSWWYFEQPIVRSGHKSTYNG